MILRSYLFIQNIIFEESLDDLLDFAVSLIVAKKKEKTADCCISVT